jgi:hypothetical protein
MRQKRSEKSGSNGPIMVQRFFLSALKPPSGATRGAWLQLVTRKSLAVTAEAAGFLGRIQILKN